MPGADEPAGVAMEPKPNPFLVASLMNGGGDQTHIQFTLATAVVLDAISGSIRNVHIYDGSGKVQEFNDLLLTGAPHCA